MEKVCWLFSTNVRVKASLFLDIQHFIDHLFEGQRGVVTEEEETSSKAEGVYHAKTNNVYVFVKLPQKLTL